MPRPVRAMVQTDQLNIDTKIVSSPHRFVVGGSAILVRPVISHHVAINGSVVCSPRASNMVRLLVRS